MMIMDRSFGNSPEDVSKADTNSAADLSKTTN
jgi:hypothetical protein